MRASLKILAICLAALPTTAFANNVYPLAPIPLLTLDDFNVEPGGIFTADVISVTDVGNCAAPNPCNTGPTSISPLYLYADTSSNPAQSDFDVNDHNGEGYLFGFTIVTSKTVGNDVGYIFTVTTDNPIYWYDAENHQTATSFGSEVVIDVNNFDLNQVGDQPDAVGYIAPLGSVDKAPPQTPEPASLTLLASGLAAAFARRKVAGKKA